MTLACQDDPHIQTGRTNQKLRTRMALLRAAVDLLQEGVAPSMTGAADRALVSTATADDAEHRIEAAGTDPHARPAALVRAVDLRMLEDQEPYRPLTKTALEQWFRQAAEPTNDPVPTRQGQIRTAIAPLGEQLTRDDLDRIAHALGLVVGNEAMIARSPTRSASTYPPPSRP